MQLFFWRFKDQIYTEVTAQDDKLLLNEQRLIFSFYLCLRLTSPDYAFIRCRLYSNQKVK